MKALEFSRNLIFYILALEKFSQTDPGISLWRRLFPQESIKNNKDLLDEKPPFNIIPADVFYDGLFPILPRETVMILRTSMKNAHDIPAECSKYLAEAMKTSDDAIRSTWFKPTILAQNKFGKYSLDLCPPSMFSEPESAMKHKHFNFDSLWDDSPQNKSFRNILQTMANAGCLIRIKIWVPHFKGGWVKLGEEKLNTTQQNTIHKHQQTLRIWLAQLTYPEKVELYGAIGDLQDFDKFDKHALFKHDPSVSLLFLEDDLYKMEKLKIHCTYYDEPYKWGEFYFPESIRGMENTLAPLSVHQRRNLTLHVRTEFHAHYKNAITRLEQFGAVPDWYLEDHPLDFDALVIKLKWSDELRKRLPRMLEHLQDKLDDCQTIQIQYEPDLMLRSDLIVRKRVEEIVKGQVPYRLIPILDVITYLKYWASIIFSFGAVAYYVLQLVSGQSSLGLVTIFGTVVWTIYLIYLLKGFFALLR